MNETAQQLESLCLGVMKRRPNFPTEILSVLANYISWEDKVRLGRVSRAWELAFSGSHPKPPRVWGWDRVEVRFSLRPRNLTPDSDKQCCIRKKTNFASIKIISCNLPKDSTPGQREDCALRLLCQVPTQVLSFEKIHPGNIIQSLLNRHRLRFLTTLTLRRQNFEEWTDVDWDTLGGLNSLKELQVERCLGLTAKTGRRLLDLTHRTGLEVVGILSCYDMTTGLFETSSFESEDGLSLNQLGSLNRLRVENCPGFSVSDLGTFLDLLLSGNPDKQEFTLEVAGTGVKREELETQLPYLEPYMLNSFGEEVLVDWITDMELDYRFEFVRILFQE